MNDSSNRGLIVSSASAHAYTQKILKPPTDFSKLENALDQPHKKVTFNEPEKKLQKPTSKTRSSKVKVSPWTLRLTTQEM